MGASIWIMRLFPNDYNSLLTLLSLFVKAEQAKD